MKKEEEEELLLLLLRSLARHCSIPGEEAEREAAIFIWPPCASLAPLSVTNGQVVNRKKAEEGEAPGKGRNQATRERNLHI